MQWPGSAGGVLTAGCPEDIRGRNDRGSEVDDVIIGLASVDEHRIRLNLDGDSLDNLLSMHAAQPVDGGDNENAKEFVSRTNRLQNTVVLKCCQQ